MNTKIKQSTLEQLTKLCHFELYEPKGLLLDGLLPNAIAYPSSDQEAAQILKLASDTGTAVAIIGNGSKFSMFNPLEKADWLITTRALNQQPIIKPDDLLVITKAGVLLSELQASLAKYGLFLPLDGEEDETIGGVLAEGGGCSHRLRYGLKKDLVLGLTIALADGNVYKFGGQTVKNVAGYDIGKLFIGSKGTLGIITEFCLRVYPIPPTSTLFIASSNNSTRVWQALGDIRKLQPTVLEIYDKKTAEILFNLVRESIEKPSLYTSGSVLIVKFSGPKLTVAQQIKEAINICESFDLTIDCTLNGEEEVLIWKRRNLFFSLQNKPYLEKADLEEAIGIKAVVPKAQMMNWALGLEAIVFRHSLRFTAIHLGALGISYVYLSGTSFQESLIDLESIASQLKGFIQVRTGPIELRKEYCYKHNSAYSTNIKAFFDVKGIINQGKRP